MRTTPSRSALQKTGSAGIKALHELHKTLR